MRHLLSFVRYVAKGALLALVAFLVINTVITFNPGRRYTYLSPTPASLFVQRLTNGGYRPQIEIFVERFGQIDGAANFDTVIGPTCNTIAIRSLGPSQPNQTRSGYCDLPLKQEWLTARLAQLRVGATSMWKYSDLGPIPPDAIMTVEPGQTYSFSSTGSGLRLLGREWGMPEPWGVWSIEEEATLNVVFSASRPAVLELQATAYRDGPDTATLAVLIGEKVVTQTMIGKSNPSATLAIPTAGLPDHLRIRLRTDQARSPADYGQNDGRTLGVGISNLITR